MGQECTLQLKGQVLDRASRQPLPYSVVFLSDLDRAVESDSLGYFSMSSLCSGSLHLEVSHVGCEEVHRYIELKTDTTILVFLEHYDHLLDEVTVHGESTDQAVRVSASLSSQSIQESGSQDLASLASSLTGVRVISNGSGLNKPMIHGQYGNRIGLINHGASHSGQQWGIGHAPEIDVRGADHLSVVKGAGALEYSGRNVSHLLLIESGDAPDDPLLHSSVSYNFQTNGRAHQVVSQLEKKEKSFSWRWHGKWARRGDQHTPDYFLRNTGSHEASSSMHLFKTLSSSQKMEMYYSFFRSEIGVLRGSHIGNLTDLENALQRDEPFFTEPDFSYAINAPRQEVQHHLFKTKYSIEKDPQQSFIFNYAAQLNKRDEYDVRRAGRSSIPSLSLRKWTQDLTASYKNINDRRIWKSGVSVRLEDNDNLEGTGTNPLLPQYLRLNPAAYANLFTETGALQFEFGGRVAWNTTDVRKIELTPTAEVVRFQHNFWESAVVAGVSHQNTGRWSNKINLSYFRRAPEVNELHSQGLHQGVSSIEEGDPNLRTEKTWKILWQSQLQLSEEAFLTVSPHYSYIDDYIFLEPQEEFRLTVRGAFPLFVYRQEDVHFYGFDAQLLLEPVEGLQFLSDLSMLRSELSESDLTVVNTPGDRLRLSIEYEFASDRTLRNTTFSIDFLQQWRQTRILDSQDFVPTPESYQLFSIIMKKSIPIKQNKLDILLRVENLFNVSYRDYLNRMRYFADEPGRRIGIQLRYQLGH